MKKIIALLCLTLFMLSTAFAAEGEGETINPPSPGTEADATNILAANKPTILFGTYWWDDFSILESPGHSNEARTDISHVYSGEDTMYIKDSSHSIVSGLGSEVDLFNGLYTGDGYVYTICINNTGNVCTNAVYPYTPLTANAHYLAAWDWSGGSSWITLAYTTTPQAVVGNVFNGVSSWDEGAKTLFKNSINWAWDNRNQ